MYAVFSLKKYLALPDNGVPLPHPSPEVQASRPFHQVLVVSPFDESTHCTYIDEIVACEAAVVPSVNANVVMGAVTSIRSNSCFTDGEDGSDELPEGRMYVPASAECWSDENTQPAFVPNGTYWQS